MLSLGEAVTHSEGDAARSSATWPQIGDARLHRLNTDPVALFLVALGGVQVPHHALLAPQSRNPLTPPLNELTHLKGASSPRDGLWRLPVFPGWIEEPSLHIRGGALPVVSPRSFMSPWRAHLFGPRGISQLPWLSWHHFPFWKLLPEAGQGSGLVQLCCSLAGSDSAPRRVVHLVTRGNEAKARVWGKEGAV